MSSDMAEEKLSIFQRVRNVIKEVTVEPVTLLMVAGSLLASTATQTLSLDKACRVNLNLSETICDAVRHQNTDDNADNERIVQEYVARLLSYKSIVTSVLPCILLVFAGGWMDITGRRKVIMLLSVMGEICVQVNNILNVIFFFQLKVEVLIFVEALFSSIVGGWSLMFLAVFSYISDVTSEKNRTYRLGLVNFCVYAGMPIGISVSGLLLKNFGYLTVYIIALSLATTNACYVIFFLSDPERTKEHKEHDNRGFTYFMKTFFNPAHIISSWKVVFRKTSDNRALRLCVLLVAMALLFGPMYGEAAFLYMSTRFRFGWDEVQYSLFQAYNMVLTIIGTMVCILVISKKLGWHDSILGIISTVSKILSSFIFAFATTGTVFFLGPIVDMVNGTTFMAMRSIFSKTVEPDEIGKLNSIVGILEVIMPLAYIPLYSKVYTATLEFLPGFIFLMGTCLTIPPLFVFIWLLHRHLKTTKSEKFNESMRL